MAYATPAQVSAYTGVAEASLPSDVERMIDRASEEVDYWTRGGVDVTDDDHALAAQNATCAIVESWITNGEPVSSANGQVQSYTAGKVSVTYSQSQGGSFSAGRQTLPGRAYQALFGAGLLSAGVAVV